MAFDLNSLPDAVEVSEPETSSSSFDLSTLPDAVPRTEQEYLKNVDIDPEHVAKVITSSKQLGVSEVYADHNIQEVQKALSVPPPTYFKSLEEQFQKTSAFLLKDPKNMALVKHQTLKT